MFRNLTNNLQQKQTIKTRNPFASFSNSRYPQITQLQSFSKLKQYQIVGYKQIKSFKQKLQSLKKKNNALLSKNKNQSILSLSRISTANGGIENIHGSVRCFNKEELVNMTMDRVNNKNENNVAKENINVVMYASNNDYLVNLNQTITRNTLNVMAKQKKMMNQTNMISFEKGNNSIHNSNMNTMNLSLFNQTLGSLSKSKQKFDKYNQTWTLSKQKKLTYPSIIEHINNFRSKMEQLEYYTLQQKKKYLKDDIWKNTLRDEKSAKTFYNDKYIEKILNTNMLMEEEGEIYKVKGKNKLEKEVEWVKIKDKQGYLFRYGNKEGNQGKIKKNYNNKSYNNTVNVSQKTAQKADLSLQPTKRFTTNKAIMKQNLLLGKKQSKQTSNSLNNTKINTTNNQQKPLKLNRIGLPSQFSKNK